MKKILYCSIALAALVVLLTGCSKDDYTVETTPSISMSSWVVSFDTSGGAEAIAISSTDPALQVANNLGWVTTTNVGELLQVSAGVNSAEASRFGYIYVSIEGAKDSIYIHQTGLIDAYNLSEEGMANCYIAKTNSEYRFNYRVKGNGGNDGESWYTVLYGAEVTDAVYADLLWEATFDGDKSSSARIIDGPPVMRGDYIYFKSGEVQGNAVISANTVDGEILWSWHIWVTDTEITTQEANGLNWMSMNLGAVNNTPGDIENRGLFYQWGRKDGFLPTTMSYADAYTMEQEQDYNTQSGNGSGRWNYNQDTRMLSDPPGNMPFAVRNPMSFINKFSMGYNDWFIIRVTQDPIGFTTNLWGTTSLNSTKTIFDPCPAGYIVPPNTAWESGTIKTDWSAAVTGSYGRYWEGKNIDIYFPAAGELDPVDGIINYTGKDLAYWTRTSGVNTDLIRHLRFMEVSPYPVVDADNKVVPTMRVSGQSVRCVKE